jgi:hypothetical protein
MVKTKPMEESHEQPFCLNCNFPLKESDKFCPSCGQKKIDTKDFSFHHLIGESFLDYFHFDSKFFRTLLPLIYKPGFLTNEFLRGKRVHYFHPFKLFLVISVIYFLLLAFPHSENVDKDMLSKTILISGDTTVPGGDAAKKSNFSLETNNQKVAFEHPDTIRKKLTTMSLDQYIDKTFPGTTGVSRYILKKTIRITISTGQSFYEILIHNSSKMVFLLIPLVALLLKLLYIRRKRLYFEHLVFTLHLHSFVFLLLILDHLLGFLFNVPMPLILLICLVYLFFALKAVYAQGTGKTILKMFLLFIAYIILAMPIFLITLTVVSFVLY